MTKRKGHVEMIGEYAICLAFGYNITGTWQNTAEKQTEIKMEILKLFFGSDSNDDNKAYDTVVFFFLNID